MCVLCVVAESEGGGRGRFVVCHTWGFLSAGVSDGGRLGGVEGGFS